MPATGELIRSLNYVDDIAATLRRIISSISTMMPEERKKLADALRGTVSNLNDVLAQLEKGA
jgi:flagellar hook-basal body complex protein FliE